MSRFSFAAWMWVILQFSMTEKGLQLPGVSSLKPVSLQPSLVTVCPRCPAMDRTPTSDTSNHWTSGQCTKTFPFPSLAMDTFQSRNTPSDLQKWCGGTPPLKAQITSGKRTARWFLILNPQRGPLWAYYSCEHLCWCPFMLCVSSDVSRLLIREPLWDIITMVPHVQYLPYCSLVWHGKKVFQQEFQG